MTEYMAPGHPRTSWFRWSAAFIPSASSIFSAVAVRSSRSITSRQAALSPLPCHWRIYTECLMACRTPLLVTFDDASKRCKYPFAPGSPAPLGQVQHGAAGEIPLEHSAEFSSEFLAFNEEIHFVV